ncbi:MAG: hypothetical protein IPH18_07705 [Chitinophagaceae bacterium]|nr:hypothetical protein [Chitinophagaceae bacterium]MBK8953450.1 hypothetical protein [Chitinophagaceae bacterium]
MKRNLLFLILICCITVMNAQQPFKRNTLFIELGGNGLMASVNYEREIIKGTGIRFQAGTGFYGSDLTVPVGLNYLINMGKSKSWLELGTGATYTKADVHLYAIADYRKLHINKQYWNLIPSIGVRSVTKENFVYRIRFTPVINHIGFIPFIGFSFGKCF